MLYVFQKNRPLRFFSHLLPNIAFHLDSINQKKFFQVGAFGLTVENVLSLLSFLVVYIRRFSCTGMHPFIKVWKHFEDFKIRINTIYV